MQLATDYWLHQFNICSLVCQAKIPNRNDPLALVIWFNAVDAPWMISLNEVCQSEIKQLAQTTGLGAAWILTKRFDSDCPGPVADQRFGNAVLYRHPTVDAGRAWWFQDQEDQDPECTPEPSAGGTNECRGAVCMRLSTPAGVEAACSTHLESSSVSTAVVQSAEYMWNATVYSESRWLAGDFNMISSQIHGSFEDLCQVDSADHFLTYDATSGLTAKIDYIWTCPGFYAPGPPLRTPQCHQTYSDHCYIFMRLTFA